MWRPDAVAGRRARTPRLAFLCKQNDAQKRSNIIPFIILFNFKLLFLFFPLLLCILDSYDSPLFDVFLWFDFDLQIKNSFSLSFSPVQTVCFLTLLLFLLLISSPFNVFFFLSLTYPKLLSLLPFLSFLVAFCLFCLVSSVYFPI